jgi:hypothetical protein
MYKMVLAVILCSSFATACGGGALTSEESADLIIDPCGDGICSPDESSTTCPADCLEVIEAAPTPTEVIDPLGYITFIVNVSDIIHLDSSAELVLKLIDLFENNEVKGEFFLTGPMVHAYSEAHPEVIQRINESGMTISYTVLPPHPLVPGFQSPLQISAINLKQQAIANYESQRLDLTTGGLIEAEPGGYQYLADMFEVPPSAVSIPDDPIKGFALPYFADAGARMVVLYDELGPAVDQPYFQEYSMWVRPVDHTLSHWTASGIDASMAWWEMQATEYAPDYQPAARMQEVVTSWTAERMPFTLVSIDEYNFYREGPPPWSMVYYQAPGSTQPNSPPFDLGAPDISSPRTSENEQAVWEAYVAMVEWASTYMEVVTSAEIVEMAEMGK